MQARTASRAHATRRRIRSQHTALRGTLRLLDALATAAAAGDADARIRLPSMLTGLLDTLVQHMDFEERRLVPLLKNIASWGPDRAQQMQSEHARQRQELAATRQLTTTTADLAKLMQTLGILTADLRADMEHEERDFLTPLVLGVDEGTSEQDD